MYVRGRTSRVADEMQRWGEKREKEGERMIEKSWGVGLAMDKEGNPTEGASEHAWGDHQQLRWTHAADVGQAAGRMSLQCREEV